MLFPINNNSVFKIYIMEILHVDKKEIKTRYLLNCFTEFSKFPLNYQFFKTANSKMLLLFFFFKKSFFKDNRRSRPAVFYKKVVLNYFIKLTGKHL